MFGFLDFWTRVEWTISTKTRGKTVKGSVFPAENTIYTQTVEAPNRKVVYTLKSGVRGLLDVSASLP